MATLAQFVPSWDAGSRAQFVVDFITSGTATFSSPSDRGTLDIANCSYVGNEFTFRSRWDNSANSTGAQFLFAQIDGVLGLTPTFRLLRSNSGLTMSAFAKFVYSYDGQTWLQMNNRSWDATYFSFSHSQPFTADRVYISLWPAWQTGRTLPWIQTIDGTGYVSDTTSSSGYIFETRTATVNEVGAIVTATPLHAFKISEAGLAPDGSAKRNMVLMSGVHSSEDIGNYALKGAVEFLVTEDVQAQTVRDWFNIYVYPLVSSAGRKGGSTRGDFQSGFMTADVNRNWPNSNLETLVKHKTAILADTGSTCEVFMDFHGSYVDSARYDYYQSGSDNAAWTTAIRTYVPSLPITLSTNTGTSTEWAASALSAPPINLTPESVVVTGDITQAYVETYGANHMRAVALLASQNYFGATLTVTGSMAAVETSLDTCVMTGFGEFFITGDMNATENTSDTCSMAGTIAQMSFVGAIPTIAGVADIPLNFDTSTFFTGLPLVRTYTLVAGTLPAGVTLNPATGVLAGTPTVAGIVPGLIVRATDTAGNAANSNTFAFNVAGELLPVAMTLIWLP